MNIGFTGLLTIVLVAAKVFGFATYGWAAAFSPVIITFALYLMILGLGLFVASK